MTAVVFLRTCRCRLMDTEQGYDDAVLCQMEQMAAGPHRPRGMAARGTMFGPIVVLEEMGRSLLCATVEK